MKPANLAGAGVSTVSPPPAGSSSMHPDTTAPSVTSAQASGSVAGAGQAAGTKGPMRERDRALLLDAAKLNKLDVVKTAIDKGLLSDPDQRYEATHRTLLMFASLQGHLPVAQVLVEKGAKVDLTDVDGDTALMLAARRRHIKVMDFLISSGADVDHQNKYGDTALSFAALNGYQDVVGLLIYHGANVNIMNKYGETPLLAAEGEGHRRIVLLLLRQGANPYVGPRRGCPAAEFQGFIYTLAARHLATQGGLAALDGDLSFLGKMAVQATGGGPQAGEAEQILLIIEKHVPMYRRSHVLSAWGKMHLSGAATSDMDASAEVSAS